MRLPIFAMAMCLALQASAESDQRALAFAGPPSVVSFPLFRMIQTRALGQGTELSFQPWQNGGQLRALVVAGEVDFSAAPTQVAANLHSRGQPVRLLTVSAWGVQWLVSRDPALRSFADLRGKELVVPLRHDMPGIVVDRLSQAQGWRIGQDIRLRATRDFATAATLLLAGQAEHVLLVEPAASQLLLRNRQTPGAAPLYRVESMQTAWARQFPQQPRLPQAGLLATGAVVQNPALMRRVALAYTQASQWCQAQRRACAALAHDYLPDTPVEALEEAIASSPLDAMSAADAKPHLQAFYELLQATSPELIGGRLPGQEFYAP